MSVNGRLMQEGLQQQEGRLGLNPGQKARQVLKETAAARAPGVPPRAILPDPVEGAPDSGSRPSSASFALQVAVHAHHLAQDLHVRGLGRGKAQGGEIRVVALEDQSPGLLVHPL